MIELRPYQKECIEQILYCHEKKINRLLVSLPTGAGKTVIFTSLIQQIKKKTLIICHTYELQKQIQEKFLLFAPELSIGMVNGNEKDFQQQVVISTIQSAVRETLN